jgi:DNA-binding ferritin-like protein
MLAQLKVYHWQTNVYARHTATDKLITSLTEKVDQFVEAMQGHDGVHTVLPSDTALRLHNIADGDAVTFLEQIKAFLTGPLAATIAGNVDLTAIRDEMLADVNQTLYLFTLK